MLLVPATIAARSISGEPSVNSSSSPESDATQRIPLANTPNPKPGTFSIFLSLLRSGAQSELYNDMVSVPAGPFDMGCSPDDNVCRSEENPLHRVTLNAYAIDKYEVTNARYAACVSAGWCAAPYSTGSYTRSSYYGNPTYAEYPVINVDWNQSKVFCQWEGKRLPTEAEWEKAARGANEPRMYPWGGRYQPPDCTLANYATRVKNCVGDTTQVGSYPSGASPYGALDMAGNVDEWVNDWYDAGYYSVSPASNPTGPTSGQSRVVRGGLWYSSWNNVRASDRHGIVPSNGDNGLGLRCARSQ